MKPRGAITLFKSQSSVGAEHCSALPIECCETKEITYSGTTFFWTKRLWGEKRLCPFPFASRTSEFSCVVSWGLPDGVRTGLRVAERHEAELAHEVELAAVVFGDLAALSGRLARFCIRGYAEKNRAKNNNLSKEGYRYEKEVWIYAS